MICLECVSSHEETYCFGQGRQLSNQDETEAYRNVDFDNLSVVSS